jgi:hypothetical protein
LDSDLNNYPANTDVGPWNTDFAPFFYTSSNFNLNTGVYTVPQNGKYLINASLNPVNTIITINGVRSVYGGFGDENIPLQLVAGDTVSIQIPTISNLEKLYLGNIVSWFSVTLLEGVQGSTGPTGSNSTINNTITTTDNTLTTISTIPTSSDNVYGLNIQTEARRTDSGSEGAVYFVRAGYKNISGVLTQLGIDDATTFNDAGSATWINATTSSGTDILIQVQGEIGKTIEWKTTYSTMNI